MKIYQGIHNFDKLDYAVVTSGTFDGVHKGHQKILKKLVEVARKERGESVLITFWPHPRMVLNNDPGFLKLINTMDEKQEILRKTGVDHLIMIPFTREFARTSSGEFIRNILIGAIGTRKLIIGYNHRFGKNREGSFESLKENASLYGFEVEEIPKHEIDHVSISSTKIRQALNKGAVDVAAIYLGRPFSLTGIIVHGDHMGRKIGFPTANIHIEEMYKLIPADGVYAAYVLLDGKRYKGMVNIGYRPTVRGKNKRIEVHILDFNKTIYDKKVTVLFAERIREEKSFKNIEALSDQLGRDRQTTLKLLK